jgi:hypothetical protein
MDGVLSFSRRSIEVMLQATWRMEPDGGVFNVSFVMISYDALFI